MTDQTERDILAQIIDAAFTPDGHGITLHQGTPGDLADALLAAGYRKVTDPQIGSRDAAPSDAALVTRGSLRGRRLAAELGRHGIDPTTVKEGTVVMRMQDDIALVEWAGVLAVDAVAAARFKSAFDGNAIHLAASEAGPTECCDRVPFELPSTDRITLDPRAVTCDGGE